MGKRRPRACRRQCFTHQIGLNTARFFAKDSKSRPVAQSGPVGDESAIQRAILYFRIFVSLQPFEALKDFTCAPLMMTLVLQGKIAIVTGASRGIGARIALEMAGRGAKVPKSQHLHVG